MIFSESAGLILNGTKTQTRRPLKKFDELRITDDGIKYIYNTQMKRVRYCTGRSYAVQPGRGEKGIGRIRVIGLRIERLQEISVSDCQAEGLMAEFNGPPVAAYILGFLEAWHRLYDGTEYAVKKDPQVIVLDFEVI